MYLYELSLLRRAKVRVGPSPRLASDVQSPEHAFGILGIIRIRMFLRGSSLVLSFFVHLFHFHFHFNLFCFVLVYFSPFFFFKLFVFLGHALDLGSSLHFLDLVI